MVELEVKWLETLLQVPCLATTATFRTLPTAGIMALWSTSCQGKRYRVRTGGEQGTERRGERKGLTNRTGNEQRTAKGEADGCEDP